MADSSRFRSGIPRKYPLHIFGNRSRRSHVLSRWPIRNKLQLGLGLLAVSVLTLFGSAYYGLYAYRGLVKSVSARSAELPLADKLRDHVAGLHEVVSKVQDRQLRDEVFRDALSRALDAEQVRLDANDPLRQDYPAQLDLFCQTLEQYREQLDSNQFRTDEAIGDDRYERETLAKIK